MLYLGGLYSYVADFISTPILFSIPILAIWLKVFPYIIAIFGTDIPNNLIEAFDFDTLAWDFYDLKVSIAVTDNKFLKMLGRYINKNINRISYFELNRLIHNVQKIQLLINNRIISEDEIDGISPQKFLFLLESFPNGSKEYWKMEEFEFLS